MTGPQRIQRKRTKGWTASPGAVYVGRGSKWGNPYVVGEPIVISRVKDLGGRERVQRIESLDPHEAVALYRLFWLTNWNVADLDEPRPEPMAWQALRGRDLMCWCALDMPCHADVLLELANS